jgi:putative sugar O-methyltransferase
MKTSSSDNNSYPQFCESAAINLDEFKIFRSVQAYKSVVETVSELDGKDYLSIALHRTPELKKSIVKFSTSELYGSPQTFKYKKYFFSKGFYLSPTTARYIKNLSDLISIFGSLEGMKIVEIGGGYGGLCKIICDVFKIHSYTLFDLSPCLKLSERFLKNFNTPTVSYLTDKIMPKNEKFDIVISNYAFSELSSKLQNLYYSNILKHSNRGYLTCNFKTHTWDRKQMQVEDFSDFPNFKVYNSSPFLGNIDVMCGVSLITWERNLSPPLDE